MTNATSKWLKMLVAAFVTGVSTGGLTSLGIPAANAVGANIPSLDWKQLGVMSLSGGIIGLFAYLKQSPVPPDPGNTDVITKPSP